MARDGKVNEDPEREDRIVMEIVVDAYDEMERAVGWYYYLQSTLRFPFTARCRSHRQTSPLRRGRRVRVLGMADSDECNSEMLVLIEWESADDDGQDEEDDDELAVPLDQLEPVGRLDAKTREAVADWHYWVARGYRF